MTDRILSIIKYFNVSPSDFAEAIGVQRSSISHLISGRNKPSLEFIQKILTRYPEINTEWLLTGNGDMLKNGTVQESGTLPFENVPVAGKEEVQKPVKRDPSPIPMRRRNALPEDKEVEKIIYLYKDKTFREYIPE